MLWLYKESGTMTLANKAVLSLPKGSNVVTFWVVCFDAYKQKAGDRQIGTTLRVSA